MTSKGKGGIKKPGPERNDREKPIIISNVKKVSTRVSMQPMGDGILVQELVVVEVDGGEAAILSSLVALCIVFVGMYIVSFFWKRFSKRTYTVSSTAILLLFPLISAIVGGSIMFPAVWVAVLLFHFLFHREILLGRRPRIVGTNIYIVYRHIFQTSIFLFAVGYIVLAYGFFMQKNVLCIKGLFLLMYVMYFSLVCRMGLDFISYRSAGSILPSHGTKKPGECPLCNKRTDGPQIELSCRETFHVECIKNWKILGKKDTCPSCREKVDLSGVAINPWQKNEYFFTQFLDFTGHLILSYAVTQGLFFFIFKIKR